MMKQFIFILSIFLIGFGNSNSQQVINSANGWYLQESGTNEDLWSCDFNGTHLGLMIVGNNGIILRTADGGNSWSIRESNTTEELFSVDMASVVVAWAVGYNSKILKTTDSGLTWFEQISNTTEPLLSVFAIDENIVWAGGTGGVLLNSTNGGTDWQQIDLGVPNYFVFEYVQFINSEMGWTNGIRRTLDGGNSWEIIYAIYDTHEIEFVDQNIGWIISSGPIFDTAVRKTTDGGFNWESQLYSPATTYRALSFIDADIGWTVGEHGTIMHTTNGGDIWQMQESGTDELLLSVLFVDDETGWAVGNSGTILKTITGGVTSVEEEEISPSNFFLGQNYPNPFNPSTKIKFTIPFVEMGYAPSLNTILKVYDLLGNEVVTLVNDKKAAGRYVVEFDAKHLPSGIYFYQLQMGKFTQTKKMVLLR